MARPPDCTFFSVRPANQPCTSVVPTTTTCTGCGGAAAGGATWAQLTESRKRRRPSPRFMARHYKETLALSLRRERRRRRAFRVHHLRDRWGPARPSLAAAGLGASAGG